MWRKKIIWIATNVPIAYIDELKENGYDVFNVTNPDDIDDILQHISVDTLALIIIDMPLPTGTNIGLRESRGGLVTGKVVLERLLEDHSLDGIPKMVFTNLEDEKTELWCKDRNVPYIRMTDYFADDFSKIVMKGDL